MMLTINRFHKEFYERLRVQVQKANTVEEMNDVLGEVYVMLNTFLSSTESINESNQEELNK